jgi:hypothetical protein
MAAQLNAAGFRPARRAQGFNKAVVLRRCQEGGLSSHGRHGSHKGLGQDEYRPAGLAREVGMPRATLKRWRRRGWVNVRQDERGHHVVWADADERRRRRRLHRLGRSAANRDRLAALTRPKQRPTP